MNREEADDQVREKLNRASTGQSEQSPVGGAHTNRNLGTQSTHTKHNDTNVLCCKFKECLSQNSRIQE